MACLCRSIILLTAYMLLLSFSLSPTKNGIYTVTLTKLLYLACLVHSFFTICASLRVLFRLLGGRSYTQNSISVIWVNSAFSKSRNNILWSNCTEQSTSKNPAKIEFIYNYSRILCIKLVTFFPPFIF